MVSDSARDRAYRLEPSDEMVDDYASITEAAIARVLAASGELDYRISEQRIRDLSFHFLRDILRISERQDDKIAGTKFAGYWAFWIRKIKPVLYAYDKAHPLYGGDMRAAAEVPQVNERVALKLAVSFLAEQGKGSEDFLHDQVRITCGNDCDGSACLENYTQRFFSHSDDAMQEYIVYSMSYRTFGPHHMTMFLDQLVFGSCQAYPMRGTLTPPELSA